jgi:hypothetical protein
MVRRGLATFLCALLAAPSTAGVASLVGHSPCLTQSAMPTVALAHRALESTGSLAPSFRATHLRSQSAGQRGTIRARPLLASVLAFLLLGAAYWKWEFRQTPPPRVAPAVEGPVAIEASPVVPIRMRPGEPPFDRDKRLLAEVIRAEQGFKAKLEKIILPSGFVITIPAVIAAVQEMLKTLEDPQRPIEYLDPDYSGAAQYRPETKSYAFKSNMIDEIVVYQRATLVHEAGHSLQEVLHQRAIKAGAELEQGMRSIVDPLALRSLRRAHPKVPVIQLRRKLMLEGRWDSLAFKKHPRLAERAAEALRANLQGELEMWYVEVALSVLEAPPGRPTAILERLIARDTGGMPVPKFIQGVLDNDISYVFRVGPLMIQHQLASHFKMGELPPEFLNQFLRLLGFEDDQRKHFIAALARAHFDPNFDTERFLRLPPGSAESERFYAWARPFFFPTLTAVHPGNRDPFRRAA